MERKEQNKMATLRMDKLIWKMGLPMIISMVLQALYNVIDSIFVTNMGETGLIANEALTYAFPIQILIIAIGVGTGVGLNSLLSKSLGEGNKEKVNKIAGNGIFLSIVIYIVFLLFGIFGAKAFISLFTNNTDVIEMGTSYLKICTCISLGAIGFTVYERFLQATGKTMLSTIAQISGAITNIILDYIFIYPLNMGVSGAALATVIGQIISMLIAMLFHYKKNNEINGNIKYIKPNLNLIKGIYTIGISATIMQALLAVMMAGMNAILSTASINSSILVGAFGIYYKIQQIALFSAFGLSNTIISILSFNYGLKDKERIDKCIKHGIIDTFIVTLVITVIFEIFARPLSNLFSLTSGTSKEMIDVCVIALRISCIGYIFMGISIAIQGVLQSLRYAIRPLIISLLRLVIFVFPIAYILVKSNNVANIVWWTFPISELLTCIISLFILRNSYNSKIKALGQEQNKTPQSNKLIICISREHGTCGKEIARQVAKELKMPFYDKEGTKKYALDNNLVSKDTTDDELYNYFLSLDVEKDSMIKQIETIKDIVQKESCVIVGRGADYILKDNVNLIRIFLYAPLKYRINKVKEMYNDTYDEAKRNVINSDKSRATYYEIITGQKWGDKNNYDLVLNCDIGTKKAVSVILNYIKTI